MANQIRTITDETTHEKIFNKYFQNTNVFIKTKNGDLKIQFVGYLENTAAFKIPYIKNIVENCLIFTRHGYNTIQALARFIEKKDQNIFLFKILKIQVIYQERGEKRQTLHEAGGKSKAVILLTNLISFSVIKNSLALQEKKIERIRESIIDDMSQAFNHIKIFFCHEGKNDPRMNYFLNDKKPVFIPDIQSIINEDNENQASYLNNIYSKDYFLQGKKELNSEITIPILYKLKMAYGYIQVNNKNPVTTSMPAIVKKFAVLIDELLNKGKVFPISEDKFIVSDISKSGIGIVFRERRYMRYFKEGNEIYCDLILPDSKVASILALVRNIILMENNIIKVGCSIEEIDSVSEAHYMEFIKSLISENTQE
jgi:hypothetical protein